jgi:Glycosyl hydrolases family 2, sugar binding domain/Glycoside hydrolase family 2 C-terminal domain 5/Glycosyl hydrolases family 2/Glycosyl hydrolases family 2, TIM barrel domain
MIIFSYFVDSYKNLTMKVIAILLALFFSSALTVAQKKQDEAALSGRIDQVINSRWTFNYFPSPAAGKGYESPAYSDSKWPAVSLPHTWNSFETTGVPRPFARCPGETGETYWWTGWGWYRKHFPAGSLYAGSKVFVEFEGVQKYCKVWLNGIYLGDHKGGYGSFDFDITASLKPGQDNLLAVAVNDLPQDEFRIHPLTEGRYNTSCGIYRNVTISVRNRLHIPMQGSAAHEGGTCITTPVVSEKEGIVRVITWVKNDNSQARSCLLQTTVSDRKGKPVQVMKTEAAIGPGELYMFDQTSRPVKDPHLWSDQDPYLYTVHSEVFDKRELTDSLSTSFGFRWFSLSKMHDTLFLNGRQIALKGAVRHQQYPWLGDAIPEWMTVMDLSYLKGVMKYNFIRTENFPEKKLVFELTDKYGIIAAEDFSALSKSGFPPDDQRMQIREMIRRDRNFASIAFWNAGYKPGDTANVKFAMSEDPTRMAGILSVKADSSLAYFTSGDKNHASGEAAVTAGEPAGIRLTSSHGKIAAGRESVVIIRADIVDSEGNIVAGARNLLSWKVSGPARLAGPAFPESDKEMKSSADRSIYAVTPAINIIRSTGVPGRIKVTVFSSGLASGSVATDAQEIPRGGSAVTEPELAGEAARPDAGIKLNRDRLDVVPEEIARTSEDLISGATGKKGFLRDITTFILNSNQLPDTLSPEFKALTGLFSDQMMNNRGRISAEDYNFNIDNYNNCRLISGYIQKTKLPPLFKESLRRYYTDLIIGRGCEKNAGEEMNWLNWIPSGGVVVMVPDENGGAVQKGVIYSKQTDLGEIIRLVYPQFAKFREEARERALVFITKMNPCVHVTSSAIPGNPAGDKKNAMTCTAEKGRPILIPEYKFISE